MKFIARLILMILSAALTIWAFPLVDQGWLAWTALLFGLLAVNGMGFRKGLILGGVYGFTLIFFVMHWLSFFGWEPHILASLYFAFFYIIFFALWSWYSKFFPPASSWQRFFLPPLLWVALEWSRCQGVLAFSWAFLGFTQYKILPLIQISSITGVYGVSFILAFFNNLLCETILKIRDISRSREEKPNFPNITASMKFPPLKKAWILFLIIFTAINLWGAVSIRGNKPATEVGVKIGVVQPNFPQEIKWEFRNLMPTLKTLEEETIKMRHESPDLILWPETCIPHRNPLNEPFIMHFLSNTARSVNGYILTGLIDKISNTEYYNGAVLISPAGEILDKYHKIHLVPMSEYFALPEKYRKYKIFSRISNYSHGKKLTLFEAPFGKFSVLICFESMFDYLPRKMVKQGAQFLTVITNDAWFQKSNAAKCHFIMGIFRAVENRVWLVQCGNTGISGIISPYGEILYNTDIFQRTSFTGKIYLRDKLTLYTRFGNWLPVLSMLISLILLFPTLKIQRNHDDSLRKKKSDPPNKESEN